MNSLHVGAMGSRHRTTVLASELRSGGRGSERLIGRNGELNAANKADLIRRQTDLAAVSQTHQIVTDRQMEVAQAAAEKAARREAVHAMMHDNELYMEIGAQMGDELYITQQREGIMRSVLQRMDVVDGQQAMVKLRARNITVATAVGPTATELQLVRDNYIYPVEYLLVARPFVEQQEITRNNTDILEDKYLETMQAFLVAEDRVFRDLCLKSAGQANNLSTQIGAMNAVALGEFRNEITRWGLTASQWLIANDIWVDITSDPGFQSLFEPMAQHEILLTGQLGTILGMTVKSDQYRHPEHKVLHKGEHFLFSTPDTLGVYTDRGGIDVLPLDAAYTGIPGRGWMMSAQQSQTIGNFRGVACGRRV